MDKYVSYLVDQYSRAGFTALSNFEYFDDQGLFGKILS